MEPRIVKLRINSNMKPKGKARQNSGPAQASGLKHFFVKTLLFYALSVPPLHATTLNSAAECSVYMNLFNQKYGLQLIDTGYTHNTVMEDDLYKRSASYQLMFIVAASLHENWNVQSYDNFI